MDAIHTSKPVGIILLGAFIVATGLIEAILAEGKVEGSRQMTYRLLLDPGACRITYLTTASVRSKSECASSCLGENCSLFQYNTTAHLCHLYSDQEGRLGLLDDSKAFASEPYHEKAKACWVMFVRRQDGSVNFDRPWADYRDGFGNPNGEFWLGLETLHTLTADQPYKLRAEMTDWANVEYFSDYSTFQVEAESSTFNLSVSGYDSRSTAGDSMSVHDGCAFSTLDVDNDKDIGTCAGSLTGGWWYGACFDAHPTGTYFPTLTLNPKGVGWQRVPGLSTLYSFKTMKLMIKP